MKVLLVTSDITYLPQNGALFFNKLNTDSENKVDAILFMKIPKIKLLKSIAFLYLAGCLRIATTLFKNLVILPYDKRIVLAKKLNIPVRSAKTINSPEIVDWLKKEHFDIIINYRTRCIYKKEVLQSAKMGCLNIHHGLLPENRGVFCDLYALYENRAAGFTIHLMNEKIDDGDILRSCQVNEGSIRNYMKYLAISMEKEAGELRKLLISIKTDHQLPSVIKNICINPRFTKNPTLKIIKKMQASGLQL